MQTQKDILPDRAFRNSFATNADLEKYMEENKVDIMGNKIETPKKPKEIIEEKAKPRDEYEWRKINRY